MTTQPERLSSMSVGLRRRCPRCGEGHLFRSYLKIDDGCEACGLDFGFADPADGPAFFSMSIVGIVVTALWAIWAASAHPPIWLQLLVVFPALIGGCLGTLPPIKAWLIAEQYAHKAEEGRWQSLGTHGKAPEGYRW